MDYKNSLSKLLAICLILSVAAVLLPLSLAFAQGCGTECFYTPTPPPTVTVTPTPGAGTPTAVPFPPTVEFPQVEYSVPTPIPTLSFPDAPSPLDITLPGPPSDINPAPISTLAPFSITPFTAPAPISISTNLSSTTPITFTCSGLPSGDVETFLYPPVCVFLLDIITYTNYLSSEVEALQATTHVITIQIAPAEYAPDLPRPLADVGYTFEKYGGNVDTGERFTLLSWAGFFGYIASLPIQLVKALYELADYLGPFGLFLGWLLVMLGLVAFIELMKFLYNAIITLIDLTMKVLDLIGQWFPGT